ncbi:MAG: glycosyltransferase [Actinomycetota bacterium]|jgi:rhamnosyltransferase|nr:glycosyltransferase [Actinomycetota bacterium]
MNSGPVECNKVAVIGARVAAAVVTYEPGIERLGASLEHLASQTDRVLVVDNGSSNIEELRALVRDYPTVELVRLDQNEGIATGFNIAVDHLAADGGLPDWVLTMDQDSLLDAGAVEAALRSLDDLDDGTRRRIGIVGARWADATPPSELAGDRTLAQFLWGRVEAACDLGHVGELRLRGWTISSGSLIRREVLESVRFRGELFIDQVDIAFCVDARRSGWLVAETDAVLMHHRIGSALEHRGSTRSYENARRLYYILRNSTHLVLRGIVPPVVYVVTSVS